MSIYPIWLLYFLMYLFWLLSLSLSSIGLLLLSLVVAVWISFGEMKYDTKWIYFKIIQLFQIPSQFQTKIVGIVYLCNIINTVEHFAIYHHYSSSFSPLLSVPTSSYSKPSRSSSFRMQYRHSFPSPLPESAPPLPLFSPHILSLQSASFPPSLFFSLCLPFLPFSFLPFSPAIFSFASYHVHFPLIFTHLLSLSPISLISPSC